MESKKLSQKIGFIGGGQMAVALAKGFIESEMVDPSQILVSAPSDKNLKFWRENLKCSSTHDNSEVILKSDIVFLATKPHIYPVMLQDIKNGLKSDEMLTKVSKLYVSVMAGTKMEALSKSLKTIVESPRVIRVLPNTPVNVRTGCSAMSLGEGDYFF